MASKYPLQVLLPGITKEQIASNIYIGGKTFPIKDLLRKNGGKWDPCSSKWKFSLNINLDFLLPEKPNWVCCRYAQNINANEKTYVCGVDCDDDKTMRLRAAQQNEFNEKLKYMYNVKLFVEDVPQYSICEIDITERDNLFVSLEECYAFIKSQPPIGLGVYRRSYLYSVKYTIIKIQIILAGKIIKQQ